VFGFFLEELLERPGANLPQIHNLHECFALLLLEL
jgi:hypothetical protein